MKVRKFSLSIVRIISCVLCIAVVCMSAHFMNTASAAEPWIKISFNRNSVDVSKGESITASWTKSHPDINVLLVFWYVYDANGTTLIKQEVESWGNTISFTPTKGVKGELWIAYEGKVCEDPATWIMYGESKEFSITGTPEANKLYVDIQLSTTSVPVNQPITANVSIKGGVPPYRSKLEWRYSIDDVLFFLDSRSVVKSGSAVSDTQTFPRGTNGDISVTVTDSKGNSFYDSGWFEIIGSDYERFLLKDAKLAKDRLKAGETQAVTITLTDSGGIPPFEYRVLWHYGGLSSPENEIIDYFTSADRSHTFTRVVPRWALGESYVSVVATDAVGLEVGPFVSDIDNPSFRVLMNDSPQESISGDANGDDTLDILDLVAIIDYIVSGTPSASMDNADANGDGTVDILDLVWIIDRIVGG